MPNVLIALFTFQECCANMCKYVFSWNASAASATLVVPHVIAVCRKSGRHAEQAVAKNYDLQIIRDSRLSRVVMSKLCR